MSIEHFLNCAPRREKDSRRFETKTDKRPVKDSSLDVYPEAMMLMSGRKALALLALFALVFCRFSADVEADENSLFAVTWGWKDGTSLSQGQLSSVDLSIRNRDAKTVRLEFVGINFDWMKPDTYVYGGGSERERMLNPGEAVTYSIAFDVPAEAAAGEHKCYAIIFHYKQGDGGWVKSYETVKPDRNLDVIATVVVTLTLTQTVTMAEAPSTIPTSSLILAIIIILVVASVLARLFRRKLAQ